MAGTNEILTFALNTGANVLAQSTWASASARGNGFSSGVADSASVNKALRQASYIAASVAQWAVDQTAAQNMSILDNGDVGNVKAVLVQAVQNLAYGMIAAGNYATVAGLNATSASLNSSIAGEAAIRASADAAEAAARIAADSAEATARSNADAAEGSARLAGDNALQGQLIYYTPWSAFIAGSAGVGGWLTLPVNNNNNTTGIVLILQWGSFVAPTGNGDFCAFPVAFPHSCLRMLSSDGGTGSLATGQGSVGLGGFLAYARNPGTGAPAAVTYNFLAVGN